MDCGIKIYKPRRGAKGTLSSAKANLTISYIYKAGAEIGEDVILWSKVSWWLKVRFRDLGAGAHRKACKKMRLI